MKEPVPGRNQIESFFDYETTKGKTRFGFNGFRLFLEKLGKTFNIDAKLVNQLFAGTINLSNDLTHYKDFTVDAALEIGLESDPVIGGSAEIRLIGDGTTTPTFSNDFTKSAGSADYSPTLAAINKVVFYYDGTDVFYSISQITVLA